MAHLVPVGQAGEGRQVFGPVHVSEQDARGRLAERLGGAHQRQQELAAAVLKHTRRAGQRTAVLKHTRRAGQRTAVLIHRRRAGQRAADSTAQIAGQTLN